MGKQTFRIGINREEDTTKLSPETLFHLINEGLASIDKKLKIEYVDEL